MAVLSCISSYSNSNISTVFLWLFYFENNPTLIHLFNCVDTSRNLNVLSASYMEIFLLFMGFFSFFLSVCKNRLGGAI